MVAYCPKDGKSYETDGVIKYTIEYNLYENHKYYVIAIIKVCEALDDFNFLSWWTVSGITTDGKIILHEKYKSIGCGEFWGVYTKMSKRKIDLVYDSFDEAQAVSSEANKEAKEYYSMPYWKQDAVTYRIPEKYHEQIKKIVEQRGDDFDFRMRNVDGEERCVYYTGKCADAFDIYTDKCVVHYEKAKWTCNRCGRTLPQSYFKNGKFTYNTTQDGKRIVNKYCDDCVDENGKVKSDKKEVKIPVPVKKIAAVKPKHEVT